MPIRNEGDFIAHSLSAVLTQDYPHDRMEVLIADGMSDDDTREIVQQIAGTTDVSVTIIDNLRRIVPTGFNAALKQAKGEIIVRVDGHCEIATNYVKKCIEHLECNEIAGVGGPIETICHKGVGETIAAAMSSAFGVGGTPFRTIKDKAIIVDTIAFPAYRRNVIDVAGLFDEELVRNQDDEYNYRLRSLGYKLLLTPDLKSRYYSRSSISHLWRQYYQYGFYKVRVMQKHPRQMRPRQFAPALLASALSIGAIGGQFSRCIKHLWFFLIIAYTIANFVASFITAHKEGWRHLPLLPVVFATLHFSYGIGFLHGLVKFRSRWSKS